MTDARDRMASADVVVVGGGLAGITAALDCADGGARVTLLERRRRLGGLTWSFDHAGRAIDGGQHVFLRCCTDYIAFLDRIGSTDDVVVQPRLDIPVLAPGRAGAPKVARLRRRDWPAPLHLATALLGYPHLSTLERARLGQAVLPLRRLRLDDPALDTTTFAAWLTKHGQSPRAIANLWDLITIPTVNLPASQASLAMAAKVFQTGLLTDTGASDIGWSRIPLGVLHGERAGAALQRAGVRVVLDQRVTGIEERGDPGSRWSVQAEGARFDGDVVVTALPHHDLAAVLPPGTVAHQDQLDDLGTSAVVDVHLVFDRHVTGESLLAGIDTPVQWVFDRTASSGLSDARSQYLAVSLSAADELLTVPNEQLLVTVESELHRLLPASRAATVTDRLVTKERRATFRAVPGTGRLRPGPRTRRPGLFVAGAWTDTGWPATMEGAVRSGHAAARAALADAGRTPATLEVA